ncbi:MAG: cupin-like domain-containing protein [Gammaproteobacteria bacterium]|nr:cupin-like domain-containing protein [Gammaproteobacteria bacterium]
MSAVIEPLAKTGVAGHSVPEVERRSALGAREFVAKYLRPRRPVILTDAAAAWPAYNRLTPDHFRRHHGEKRITIEGREWRLDELIDTLEASTQDQPGPYPCKFAVVQDFPELLPEVSPRIAYSLPDRQNSALLPDQVFSGVNNLEIFFGGPGGRFPYLHYDVLHLHAWITQLHGRKAFTLFPPDQKRLLYINPDMPWQSSIENHQQPDYRRYPLFKQAASRSVVIEPGETLFLPCGWWHTARSLEMTISIAFDQLESGNWRDFKRDFAIEHRHGRPALTAAVRAWLALAGPLLRLIETAGGGRNTHWKTR